MRDWSLHRINKAADFAVTRGRKVPSLCEQRMRPTHSLSGVSEPVHKIILRALSAAPNSRAALARRGQMWKPCLADTGTERLSLCRDNPLWRVKKRPSASVKADWFHSAYWKHTKVIKISINFNDDDSNNNSGVWTPPYSRGVSLIYTHDLSWKLPSHAASRNNNDSKKSGMAESTLCGSFAGFRPRTLAAILFSLSG